MAYNVFATGKGIISGKTCVHNEFDVDLHLEKEGKLSVEIDGPSRAEIHYNEQANGHVKVTYKVSSPGDYRIHVKFNTFFVQSSPFIVHVTGSGPCGLMRNSQTPGIIRATRHSNKPLTFSTSADFRFFRKPDFQFSLNGGENSVKGSGGRSVIESADLTPLAVRQYAYL